MGLSFAIQEAALLKLEAIQIRSILTLSLSNFAEFDAVIRLFFCRY